jgi:hypothetical protein
MIKLLNLLVDTTPGLNYHLKHNLPISENVYRYSSKAFIELFNEARTLHRDGSIQLCKEDRLLLETTDIGEYAEYDDKIVPLDVPFKYTSQVKIGMLVVGQDNGRYRVLDIKNGKYYLKPTTEPGLTATFPDDFPKDQHSIDFWDYFTLERITEAGYHEKSIKCKECGHKWTPLKKDKHPALCHDCGYDNQKGVYNMKALEDWEALNEAEYHGKDVPLNKPKRGGSKKFYVYTKNKKGNVVKVSFGGTTGLNVKIDEPGARSSFAARHQCHTKKDKTKPGYWACNIGRYWKSLGGSRNFSGYW